MSVDSIKLKIFNSALRQAQAPRIQRLDEQTASALACSDLYDLLHDQTLLEFEWPWARIRVAITADATDPIGDTWDARYAVPADFLRLHKIDTEGVDEYYIEGSFILCNETTGPITIVYFQDDIPITSASTTFQRLVEKRRASALASDLSHDRILSRQLAQDAFEIVTLAHRECSDWSREEAPLSLRAPGFSGRLPHYGNV